MVLQISEIIATYIHRKRREKIVVTEPLCFAMRSYGAMQPLSANLQRHSFRGKNYLNFLNWRKYINFCKPRSFQRFIQPLWPLFKENIFCGTVSLRSFNTVLFRNNTNEVLRSQYEKPEKIWPKQFAVNMSVMFIVGGTSPLLTKRQVRHNNVGI